MKRCGVCSGCRNVTTCWTWGGTFKELVPSPDSRNGVMKSVQAPKLEPHGKVESNPVQKDWETILQEARERDAAYLACGKCASVAEHEKVCLRPREKAVVVKVTPRAPSLLDQEWEMAEKYRWAKEMEWISLIRLFLICSTIVASLVVLR